MILATVTGLSNSFIIGGMVSLVLLAIKFFDYSLDKNKSSNTQQYNTKTILPFSNRDNQKILLQAATKVNSTDFRDMETRIKRLDDLHAPVDADNVPLVYFRASLSKAVDDLAISIAQQNEINLKLLKLLKKD